MAKILGLSYCALSILSLVPLISCLPGSDTSLESRQFLNSYDQQVFKLTFYGAPDSWLVSKNCEASVSANNGSNTIAHPYCHWNGGYRGQYAGGDGSYGNPLTAASLFTSNNSPIPQCGVWYSPFLQKWLIYEDDCPSCPGKPGGAHFDIWVGGNGGGAGKAYNNPGICQCEDFLTPGGNNGGACSYWNVFKPSWLPVNTADLWDGSNCNKIVPKWQYSTNNNNLQCFHTT